MQALKIHIAQTSQVFKTCEVLLKINARIYINKGAFHVAFTC